MFSSLSMAAVDREGLADGDSLEEFRAVYDETLPAVLRYLRSRVGDPMAAEDLAADVFEQALLGWPRFQRRSSPRTWVLGIAHHVLAQHWRRAGRIGRQEPLGEGHLVEEDGGPEAEIERREDAGLLHRAIQRLSDEEQNLLALRYAAELSFEEIAAILGVRNGTVRVRMHRLLGRLRHQLESMEANR